MGDFHRGADRTTDLLREDLGEAGYTVDVVEALLGPLASAALHREQPVPARRLLARLVDERDDSPHATLVRLFLLAQPVTRSELDARPAVLGHRRPRGARHHGQLRACAATTPWWPGSTCARTRPRPATPTAGARPPTGGW